MKLKAQKMSALVVAVAMTFAACKKVEETKESITSAEDQAICESAAASTYDVVDDASATSQFGKGGSTILPNGAVFTITDSTMTGDGQIAYFIDFGALGSGAKKGILCQDGRYRAGKIRVVQKMRFTEVGCIVTADITDADEYYVGNGEDMVKVTGEFKGTRTAENTVKLNITNGKCVTKNGTVEFYSEKTITRTVDSGLGVMGDEFEASGNGGGKNRNGESFTWNISSPLVKKMEPGCASTFTKGVISLSNSVGSSLTFDFDPDKNGDCDKKVEVTFPNGRKQTFTLN